MKKDPLYVALWRFEQISAFLDKRLTPGERARMIEEASRIELIWPNGDQGPVAKSSLYRWLHAYQENPVIESLKPKARKPPERQPVIQAQWVDYALALLEEEPVRSLFILRDRIKRKFNVESEISSSSLHRALQGQPRYKALRRRDKDKSSGGALRRRFQAVKAQTF
jgi:hypothetical protein